MNNPEFIKKNVAKFVALGTLPNVNNIPHYLIKLVNKSKILNYYPCKSVTAIPKELGQI